jgi:malonyl-CoA O-methyltransferase
MPASTGHRSTARPVDERALARVRERMQRAPSAPWLHTEVARRMAERLPLVRLQPQQVLDWGAHVGGGRSLLQQAYARARITAVDDLPGPAAAAAPARPWWARLVPGSAAPHGIAPAQVPAGQAQLVWSNMQLHGSVDPQAVMRSWQQALQVDGFLMFSTLGPGTLQTLSTLYRAQGWQPPLAPFVDMHDLGDMLVEAGFADPVMDQETITLTWADAAAALAELRALGGNVDPGRFGGLRTPRWRQRLFAALRAQAAEGGRIALAFEVVYGHAFRAPPRHPVQAQTSLPLDDMRAMIRAGRSSTR